MERISHLGPLSLGEKTLLAAQGSGERAVLASGDQPTEPTDETRIRAELLRILLIGSDPKFKSHQAGVRLRGAWVTGQVDLQGCQIGADITLSKSVLEKAPNLVNSRLRGLHISGCELPGLIADQAHFDGPLFLRAGCLVTGEISLPSARIDGDLQLCDVDLRVDRGVALFANGLTVLGSIYMGDHPYSPNDTVFTSTGAMYLASARIDRDFYIKNVSVSGDEDAFQQGQFDGAEGSEGMALSLARCSVGGVFFAKALRVSGGIVNLSGAKVKRLNDEPDAEDASFRVRLDGFEYASFAQHTNISVQARLAWLDRKPSTIGFSAQPFEQLARVYEQLGHRDDADLVRMAKEELQREDDIHALRDRGARLRPFLLTCSKALLKYLVGYGYRPIYALIWTIVLIALTSAFFHITWKKGDMAPNSAPILVSQDWVAATISTPSNPAEFWSSPGQAGQDYETFHPVAYAADLFIPIVNFGQEDAWAPSTSRSPWGRQGWWIRWVAKLLGWVFTALVAAAVTGVIRRG